LELFGTLFIIIIYAYPNINCYSITCTTLPDLELEHEKLVEYYQLRFQIEFNFRDANLGIRRFYEY